MNSYLQRTPNSDEFKVFARPIRPDNILVRFPANSGISLEVWYYKAYPHTIENGAGEQRTFRRLVSDPTGDWLEGESLVQLGDGPPMHVHYYRKKHSPTVQQGRLGYQDQASKGIIKWCNLATLANRLNSSISRNNSGG